MVTSRKKKIITIAMMLALWFLVADAYWMSKERSVEKCVIDKSTELVSRNLYNDYFRTMRDSSDFQYTYARFLVEERCSWAEGGGYGWNNYSGLAYWEIFVTLPVIYRYRFD